MRERVGVGVIGCGFWATTMHLPSFVELPGADLVAVAGLPEEEPRAMKFGPRRFYSDYRALLDDDEVQLVDICTPNYLHAEMAIAAAEAGKHVICIKPLALNVDQAQKMIDAAKTNGVKLMYAENVLFIPALLKAKQIVDSGGIGRVFRVKACEGIPGPPSKWFYDPEKTGGGCIIDMAVHSMAFCKWFAGGEVTRIYAETGTFVHDMRDEDTSVITMRFDNGTVGQAEDSWSLVGGMDSRFEVYGTKGRILVDMLYSQPIRVTSSEGYRIDGIKLESGWTYPPSLDGKIADGHMGMLEHFLDCVMNDRTPRSTGEDGLEVLRFVEAAKESALTYRSVKVKRA